MLIEVLKFEVIFIVERPLTSYIISSSSAKIIPCEVHGRCVPVNRSQKIIAVKFRVRQGVSRLPNSKFTGIVIIIITILMGLEAPRASVVVQYLPTPDFTTASDHISNNIRTRMKILKSKINMKKRLLYTSKRKH